MIGSTLFHCFIHRFVALLFSAAPSGTWPAPVAQPYWSSMWSCLFLPCVQCRRSHVPEWFSVCCWTCAFGWTVCCPLGGQSLSPCMRCPAPLCPGCWFLIRPAFCLLAGFESKAALSLPRQSFWATSPVLWRAKENRAGNIFHRWNVADRGLNPKLNYCFITHVILELQMYQTNNPPCSSCRPAHFSGVVLAKFPI